MTFCHHGVGDALDTPELRAIAVTDWFDAVDHLKQTVALDNSDFYTLHHSRTRPLPPSRPGIGFPPFPFASSNQPSLLVSQTRPDSVTPLPLFCPRLTHYPFAISLPAKNVVTHVLRECPRTLARVRQHPVHIYPLQDVVRLKERAFGIFTKSAMSPCRVQTDVLIDVLSDDRDKVGYHSQGDR